MANSATHIQGKTYLRALLPGRNGQCHNARITAQAALIGPWGSIRPYDRGGRDDIITGVSKAFVIQAHSGHGRPHCDLMLEHGSVLVTWQLPVPPAGLEQIESVGARKLPDHRTAYLSYEGPVSGGRGRVDIADEGEYELIADDENHWLIRLNGQIVRGRFELRKRAGQNWTLVRLSTR